MRHLLAIIGPLIAAYGFIPYLRETLCGKVRPRIASWATWTLVTGVGTIAAISEHSYASAILTGNATLIELTILIAALKKGDRDYNLVDGISQFISLFGIVAWISTSDAVLAILFNILADACGVVPTLYHSWIHPEDESWPPFFLSGLGATLSCLAVTKFSVGELAFPVYLAVVGYLIGFVIFIRQKMAPITT